MGKGFGRCAKQNHVPTLCAHIPLICFIVVHPSSAVSAAYHTLSPPPQSASFSVSYLSLSPSSLLVHLCSCSRVASHMCLVLLLFLKWSLQAWGHVEWSEKYPFPTPALCSFPEFFMTSRRFRFSDTALALIVFDESVVHINNHVYRHFLIVHFGSMCDVPPGPP